MAKGRKIKIKTHKGAAKRFKRTRSKKAASKVFKRKRSTRNHILTKRTTKNKRQLRKQVPVGSSDAKQVQRMLPND